MSRAIRLRDPQTGRTVIVYQEPVEYHPPPMPVYQHPPAQYEQPYYPPAPYKQPRQRGGLPRSYRERRGRKAVTWLVGTLMFGTAFCSIAIHPGLGVFLFFVWLAFVSYRSIRD